MPGPVAHRTGEGLAPTLSPRPHLLLRTLAGRTVTAAGPADHPHHLGLSVAIADVDGHSYWGGPTYVHPTGYAPLTNHGAQVVTAQREVGDAVEQEIAWVRDGEPDAHEVRRLEQGLLAPGWVLRWRSHWTPARGEAVLGSPATNGRDGAFYGGWFLRTALARARVTSAAGAGTDAAHGSQSPWLGVVGDGVTLLALQHGPVDPWFVRTEGYVGFGPALAHRAPRRVGPGGLAIAVDLLVADGELGDDALAALAARLGTVKAG